MKPLILSGDGAGVEVTAAAVRLPAWFRAHRGFAFDLRRRGFGLVR